MPCLFRVHSGPYRGKVFPVEPNRPLLIGRALEADFTIPDGAIQPFHCRVEFESGQTGRMAKVIALDASPDHQLEVDGVPFDSALLKSGDKVRMGETVLEFREGGGPSEPVGGAFARPGIPCVACRRPIPEIGGGRVLLGLAYCVRCVDLRLIVRRDLGRYRVLRKIGRDVAEIVYMAEDLRSSPPEKVALHVMKSERHRDARVVRRFLLKAASGFGMDHPLFPLTRDLVRKPDVVSYVEELCDWPSLFERLETGRTLPLHVAAKAAHQVADGLRFARRRGMIVGKIRALWLYVSDSGAARIRQYWLAPEVEERLAASVGAPEAPPLPEVAPAALAGLENPADESLGAARSDSAVGEGNEPTERPDGAPRRGGGGEDGDLLPPEPAISADMRRYLAPDARDLQHWRDESLDVRPIGAVFAQLATGAIAGDPAAEDVLDRLKKAHAERRRPAAPADPPALLDRVVLRSLDKNPANRYRTLLELAKDLKAIQPAL